MVALPALLHDFHLRSTTARRCSRSVFPPHPLMLQQLANQHSLSAGSVLVLASVRVVVAVVVQLLEPQGVQG